MTNLPDSLHKSTNAVYVGTFENQSPKWHEQRSKGIGGSDVGVLCGLSPWESAYTWAAKRLGKIDDTFTGSEAAEWGTLLEPVILDWFERNNHQLKLHRNVGSWHHPEHTWQLANPDAIYQQGDTFGIVEVKTARYEDGWDEKTNTIPPHYRAQVLWYLQTFGFSHAYVVVLFSGSKPRVFEVEYEAFEADVNRGEAEAIWNMVQAGELPDFSSPFSSTYQTTREMHPDIDADAEVELGDLGIHYQLALREHELSESHLNEMRSRVSDALGKAKRGTIDGRVIVTRQSRNGGTPYLVNSKK